MRRRKNQTRAGRQEPCRENSKVVNVASSARSDREIALIRPATATRRRDLTTIATWRWNRRRRAPRRSDSSTRHEQSRDRRFKKEHPDSQDAETIGAFQRRDPASFSSFFTIVRRSFSGTAARGGALLRSRERRRYERETPPPARRDDVRVPFGNKHILLGGGAAARPRVSPPMSPQVLGPISRAVWLWQRPK